MNICMCYWFLVARYNQQRFTCCSRSKTRVEKMVPLEVIRKPMTSAILGALNTAWGSSGINLNNTSPLTPASRSVAVTCPTRNPASLFSERLSSPDSWINGALSFTSIILTMTVAVDVVEAEMSSTPLE